jgi:hypothetical protein
MYRCALALALTATCLVAHAQQHRTFPAKALRGELIVTQFPDALMNGRPVRFAPGARIKSDTNLWVPPAGLTGQKVVVHYTFESTGMIMDAWVLNPAELANKPWPTTPAQSAAWAFNPGNQTWVTQ